MLCSPKSGSNWLDRLRSSKGFPVADTFDLDHFLSSSPPNSHSTHSDIKLLSADRSQSAETSAGNGVNQWFGVLCDLFNMGESGANISRLKKSVRKQTKPKFCVVSIPCAANDLECMRKDEYVSDKNSNVGTNAESGDADEDKEKSSGGNGGGSDKEELNGFSRSEVTVIDTSFDLWKLDKLVFRRKNLWKVVDKNQKSWTVGSKKRKGNHSLDSSAFGNVAHKKKSKLINPVNEGMKQQDQEQEEVCKYSFDVNFQVPRKRINFCRSAGKSKKNCASVLIKAISSANKCRKIRHLKETQKE